MVKKNLISGKAHIIVKHNEVQECKLGDKLSFLTLVELVGLNKVAPKSATVFIDEEPVTYYNTPSGTLFPDGENLVPFHIPDQSVRIRLQLDNEEFSEKELGEIEMVLSIMAHS